ncbi:hypothetical protein FAGAP_2768 [Fusarium agapanthi]|uniref:Uncharacterized protein n=1 Tax=Fusarium agapanthi TaxID=1803897 RepID=A0A9P5BGZ1_9HYPO|nr:hypothetical protein FAGAP_2768 [Fusarium agapanthi]
MAWQYSPDVVIPFIAESDVACDQDPGWNKEATFTTMYQHWIDDGALKDGRFCFNEKSYWLLGGRDRNTNCDSKSGDSNCGDFALPPGWQSLKDKKSLNSKAANGGKNGFKLELGDEPSREVLDSCW